MYLDQVCNSEFIFLMHFSLSEHINERAICNAVAPEKDVDGFHIVNIGKLCLDQRCMVPATAAAVWEIIRRTGLWCFQRTDIKIVFELSNSFSAISYCIPSRDVIGLSMITVVSSRYNNSIWCQFILLTHLKTLLCNHICILIFFLIPWAFVKLSYKCLLKFYTGGQKFGIPNIFLMFMK